jgi:GT2 family glycosyltransferase
LNNLGIVVPTLGSRPEYLIEALKSIRNAGVCYIVIVAPLQAYVDKIIDRRLFDELVEDPMQGLVNAISTGVRALPQQIEYFNWLGDDDTLAPNSLRMSSSTLEDDPAIVCVFGMCQYINRDGQPIYKNRSGHFAVPLLKFGPQLIPQPGALFRRTSFNKVGGLDPTYECAFDLDLLLKLKKIGKIRYIPYQLSSFRWHSDSLSVRSRSVSIHEAREIRQKNLSRIVRSFSPAWELPLAKLIYYAGTVLTKVDEMRIKFRLKD